MKQKKITRRQVLLTSSAAAFAFTIVPRHVLGGPGYIAPSEVIQRGIIGCGSQAGGHVWKDKTSNIIGLCDVDQSHLKTRLNDCKNKGHKAGIKTYHDFRDLLDNKDIDVVHIVTPPHWHGLQAIMAAEAGKDIWCEKPLTRTIAEGQKLVEACNRNATMLRVNTWFRLYGSFYGAGVTVKELKKLVQSKMLGWPLKVTIGKHTGFNWKIDQWSGKLNLPKQEIPKELDYDFWLGPAPNKTYHKHRVHRSFRGYWDYDGGGLGDMGMHYIDPVQYILGKDGTGPVKIEVDSDDQHTDAVKGWRRITYTYADGCQIVLDGDNSMKDAAYIEGPNGKVFKNFKSTIKNLKNKLQECPNPKEQITTFWKSVRTRQKFGLNEVNGHRSASIVNLGKIALRVNRTLKFDPEKQSFVKDDEANRLIDQPMRGEWSLNGAKK